MTKKHITPKRKVEKDFATGGYTSKMFSRGDEILIEKPIEQVGLKYDKEKPRMALLPFDALHEVSKVLSFGAEKYAPDNWKHIDNAIERYGSAMLRHYAAFQRGELLDKESKLPHLAHLACCALFLLWHGEVERKRKQQKSIEDLQRLSEALKSLREMFSQNKRNDVKIKVRRKLA